MHIYIYIHLYIRRFCRHVRAELDFLTEASNADRARNALGARCVGGRGAANGGGGGGSDGRSEGYGGEGNSCVGRARNSGTNGRNSAAGENGGDGFFPTGGDSNTEWGDSNIGGAAGSDTSNGAHGSGGVNGAAAATKPTDDAAEILIPRVVLKTARLLATEWVDGLVRVDETRARLNESGIDRLAAGRLVADVLLGEMPLRLGLVRIHVYI